MTDSASPQSSPAATDFDDIPETALAWHREGKGAVLATVVETWGSAPRPVGAQLAVSGEGEIDGLGLGRLRRGRGGGRGARGAGGRRQPGADLRRLGRRRLRRGPRLRRHHPGAGGARRRRRGHARRTCWRRSCAARAERRPLAYVVDTDTWEPAGWRGPRTSRTASAPTARASRRTDSTFVAIHNPPLRMVVVGAVHIAQPLMQMARLAGYDADPDRPARGLRRRGPVPGRDDPGTTGRTRRWRSWASTRARPW